MEKKGYNYQGIALKKITDPDPDTLGCGNCFFNDNGACRSAGDSYFDCCVPIDGDCETCIFVPDEDARK